MCLNRPDSDQNRRMESSKVVESRFSDGSAVSAAERFNALADPARIEILTRLRRTPQCVCDLGVELGMASNLLSYHLRILREASMVSSTRRGRRVEYRIEPLGLELLSRDLARLLLGESPR